jgi:hypothetical protein
MVRLACDHCPRRGQYPKNTNRAPFGGDVLMPDVRHPRNARAMMHRQCTMRICERASDNVGVANQVKSAASLIALVGANVAVTFGTKISRGRLSQKP